MADVLRRGVSTSARLRGATDCAAGLGARMAGDAYHCEERKHSVHDMYRRTGIHDEVHTGCVLLAGTTARSTVVLTTMRTTPRQGWNTNDSSVKVENCNLHSIQIWNQVKRKERAQKNVHEVHLGKRSRYSRGSVVVKDFTLIMIEKGYSNRPCPCQTVLVSGTLRLALCATRRCPLREQLHGGPRQKTLFCSARLYGRVSRDTA